MVQFPNRRETNEEEQERNDKAEKRGVVKRTRKRAIGMPLEYRVNRDLSRHEGRIQTLVSGVRKAFLRPTHVNPKSIKRRKKNGLRKAAQQRRRKQHGRA